jgi:hypothetical protein
MISVSSFCEEEEEEVLVVLEEAAAAAAVVLVVAMVLAPAFVFQGIGDVRVERRGDERRICVSSRHHTILSQSFWSFLSSLFSFILGW